MNIGFFAKSWPRRGYDSSVDRSISLIETLVNNHHQLTIFSDDFRIENKDLISKYPLDVIDVNPNKINASLNSLKSKQNLFIFDSPHTERQYSAFLYNKWNQCPRVLDLSALPKLEKWRKSNYQSLVSNILIPHNAQMSPSNIQQFLEQEEIRSINRSDFIFTGNQFLHNLLEKHTLCKKKCAIIPSAYPTQEYISEIQNFQYRPFQNRKNFVFLGNLSKQSNKDAVHCLITDIWPIIKTKMPEVQLHIYGEGDGKFLKNRSSQLKKNGIVFKGYMEDTLDLSEYRAMLMPSVYSVGLRGKITQSFFSHLPVVTTPIGAQGTFLESTKLQYSGNVYENSSFSGQEQFNSEDRSASQKCKRYYDNGIMNNKNGSIISFGGSFNNFTHLNFAESAMKIYQNQQIWNECLKIGQKTILNKFNEVRVERMLKKTLVQVEMAAYEGRGKGAYEDEWRRYTRSSEFHQKMKA